MPTNFEIRPTDDLRQVVKELKEVADGKELKRELTAGIRASLRPIVAKARAAYRAIPEGPSKPSKSRAEKGDLTELLAKAVRLQVLTSGRRAGARIMVDARKMPDGMRSLPGLAEGEGGVDRRAGRWRHPVFGNREVWVQQPSFPTFYRTVEPYRDEVQHAIDQVLNDVKRKLEAQR